MTGPAHQPRGDVVIGLAWFPAGEWERARERSSELRTGDQPAEHTAYSRARAAILQLVER